MEFVEEPRRCSRKLPSLGAGASGHEASIFICLQPNSERVPWLVFAFLHWRASTKHRRVKDVSGARREDVAEQHEKPIAGHQTKTKSEDSECGNRHAPWNYF